ncbi:MAG: bifunctional folylpolyglutamate synthase/dihydrofolate synthase, partial [Cyanobacteria bacterium]|nr:bifunctional folylpolyglutamate synthase/dihydrofolate synthase [Cyanobacteriota bacterium]
MASVLAAMENPQEKIPIIHIAGTNGKGSCSALFTSILKSAGYKVGTFISPHLVDVRERISINQEWIGEERFHQEVFQLAEFLAQYNPDKTLWPTYFEFLNILAYRYFMAEKVDIAVFEVGLGGRLDSTNIIQKPILSVITTIGLDHVERLGGTLEKIAFEKAGILKSSCPVVLGPNIPGEALKVIDAQQKTVHSNPCIIADPQRFRGVEDAEGLQPFLADSSKKTIEYDTSPDSSQFKNKASYQILEDLHTGTVYQLPLLGAYQQRNLSTVLSGVEVLQSLGWTISQSALVEGVANTQWPARFQYFSAENIVIDGSHNPDGFEVLEESLGMYFNATPIVWVLSLQNNRPPEGLIQLVLRHPNTRGIIWTQAQKMPSATSEKKSLYHPPGLMKAFTLESRNSLIQETHGAKSVSGALSGFEVLEAETCPLAMEKAVKLQEQFSGALILVSGSLYTAGEALKWLKAQSTTP